MADRTRRTLLVLLGTTIAVSAASIAVVSFYGKVSELKGRIAEYDRQTASFGAQSPQGYRVGAFAEEGGQSLTALQAAIRNERSRYYSANEISVSRFAEQIQQQLLAAGLAVTRYRPVDRNANTNRNLTSVEFVVRGSARAFLSFLRECENAPHYRFFSSAAVRAIGSSGNVDATFRVGYEEQIVDSDK